ncbi:MAG: branched-chain amino acid ABC transporter permease [Pirellulales bacterium]
MLAAVADFSPWQQLAQHCLDGLAVGALIALVALGYTMVYGIIGLINFAHGDVFMLGALLAWTMLERFGLSGGSSGVATAAGLVAILLAAPLFCAALNVAIDRLVYRPLRDAPPLAPLVSAIGVSFILMNIGQFWAGEADRNVPAPFASHNLLGENAAVQIRSVDALLFAVVVPLMILLTLLVQRTRLGRAMRATSQNRLAAQLMGVNVERVIAATFGLGGALAGVAAFISVLYNPTVNFQMGYQNGLYAFTAAVLGGIGNIPGAVLGGLVIGLVRSLGTGYVGERWTSAIVFAILILILVFRPAGLLGRATKEKV